MRSYGTSGVLVRSRVPAVGHAVDEGELGPLASTQLARGRDPSLFWRALVGAGVVAVFVLAALTAYSGRPPETWQLKGGQGGRGSSLTKPTSFRVSFSLIFFWCTSAPCACARSLGPCSFCFTERESRGYCCSSSCPCLPLSVPFTCFRPSPLLLLLLLSIYKLCPPSVSACFFTAAAKRASRGAINCWSCIMIDPGSAFILMFCVVMHQTTFID